VWRALSESKGLFQCIFLVFKLQAERSVSAYKALAEYVASNSVVVAMLPEAVAAYLPMILRGSLNESSRELSGEEINGLYNDKRMGLIQQLERRASKSYLNASDQFVEEFPRTMMHMFDQRRHSVRRPSGAQMRKLACRLAEQCIKDPNILVQFPESWGKLLEMAAPFKKALTEAILAACSWPTTEKGYVGRIEPFKVRLPTEASLLPHIINCLINKIFTRN
jgi:hypothetical protein